MWTNTGLSAGPRSELSACTFRFKAFNSEGLWTRVGHAVLALVEIRRVVKEVRRSVPRPGLGLHAQGGEWLSGPAMQRPGMAREDCEGIPRAVFVLLVALKAASPSGA